MIHAIQTETPIRTSMVQSTTLKFCTSDSRNNDPESHSWRPESPQRNVIQITLHHPSAMSPTTQVEGPRGQKLVCSFYFKEKHDYMLTCSNGCMVPQQREKVLPKRLNVFFPPQQSEGQTP